MEHEVTGKKNDLIFSFIRLDRMHRAAFDAAVRRLGIQRNQHMLLMFLARHGRAVSAQKEIATELGVSPASVSGTLNWLERENLICRSTGTADSRKNEIGLTERGKAMVEETHRIFSQVDNAMIGHFSPEELERLSQDFSRMADNLTAWMNGGEARAHKERTDCPDGSTIKQKGISNETME